MWRISAHSSRALRRRSDQPRVSPTSFPRSRAPSGSSSDRSSKRRLAGGPCGPPAASCRSRCVSAAYSWRAFWPVTLVHAERAPVLAQIDLPHPYYYREMYLPQLTSGPSSVAWSPDSTELIYAMAGSLWRQKIGSSVAQQLTASAAYDYQPDWSPDGRWVIYCAYRRQRGGAVDSGSIERCARGRSPRTAP